MTCAIRVFVALLTTTILAGCGPSIFSLRVPLQDTAGLTTTAGNSVSIDDQRPEKERKVRTGGGLITCKRYYGDETYVPAKVEYLRQLLQARVPAGSNLHLRLDRLDTIEYCDATVNRSMPGNYTPTTSGDRVVISAAGEANGKPFDVSREFDYTFLTVPFPQMPASNNEYVVRFKRIFGEIADEIAGKAAR